MPTDELSESLTALAAYLDLTPETATTLPPRLYISDEVYDREIETIWSKTWVCVAHEAELPNPGDFVGLELIGEPIAIMRGHDHQIRALSSVCRHRFMPIVEQGDRGNAQQLRCPYHRWTYATDGRLEAAAYMDRNSCFEMNEIRLPTFQVETWNGFIFVNLDDDAPPLAPQMSGLDAHFRRNRLVEDCADWVLIDRYDKIWDCNWKASTENSLESYHHMGVHRSSVELYAPTRSVRDTIEYGERHSYYEVPYDMRNDLSRFMVEQSGWAPGDMGMDEPTLEISFTPPTTAFTVSPESFGYYTMWPISKDKTRVYCGVFGRPGAEGEQRAMTAEYGSFLEQVMDEDGSAMPGIHRSLSSRKAEAGKLSWLEEPILRWYQWIARQMDDESSAGRS